MRHALALRPARSLLPLVAFVVFVPLAFATGAARADEPVTPADKKAASETAQKASKAEAAHSFVAAAEGYESAFTLGRTWKWLASAASARQTGGDPAAAANDYARYLAGAPETEKGRATAKKELAVLGAKLGRLSIKAPGATAINVDSRPIDLAQAASFYVMPGPHLVEARFPEQSATESPTALAGQSTTVTLTAPAIEAPAPAPVAVVPVTTEKPRSTRPLPPFAVYLGAGVTVLLGGLTVMSGLDTLSQKESFDGQRSQANLDDGKSKQLRTNILLAGTGVVALATGAMAIFLVDWRRTDTKLGFGPGSVFVERRF